MKLYDSLIDFVHYLLVYCKVDKVSWFAKMNTTILTTIYYLTTLEFVLLATFDIALLKIFDTTFKARFNLAS